MIRKKEVKELTFSVTQLMEQLRGTHRVEDLILKMNQRLREENTRLVLQNNKLFDRLMAKNFETYATYKEDEVVDLPFPSGGSNYEPDKDEQNIGEVIDNETTG